MGPIAALVLDGACEGDLVAPFGSEEGGQQGDPLTCLLFCVWFHSHLAFAERFLRGEQLQPDEQGHLVEVLRRRRVRQGLEPPLLADRHWQVRDRGGAREEDQSSSSSDDGGGEEDGGAGAEAGRAAAGDAAATTESTAAAAAAFMREQASLAAPDVETLAPALPTCSHECGRMSTGQFNATHYTEGTSDHRPAAPMMLCAQCAAASTADRGSASDDVWHCEDCSGCDQSILMLSPVPGGAATPACQHTCDRPSTGPFAIRRRTRLTPVSRATEILTRATSSFRAFVSKLDKETTSLVLYGPGSMLLAM